MKERTILHSDVNNFFASVECSQNPKLFGKPVAVTGNPDKRTGIILAKNEIAKKSGVKTGEAIWQAKQKCPNLVTVGPHYDLYEKISKQLHELYLNYTDLVEPLGLDECWLDITPSLKYLQMTGKEIADEIRKKVKEKFGFTVSVGVSFSKLFAKLGSDMKKPDATTVISRETFKEQTYNLPLNSIIGIGSRLNTKFEKRNIQTIGDFVALDENYVRDIMGKTGVELHQKLKGEFVESVPCYFLLAPPKSIGNGTTTIEDIQTREDIAKVVAFLCEKVALRMTNGNFQASTITVTLKTNDFEKYRHSKTVAPFKSEEDIYKNAMLLIDEFWKFDKLVRAIRVRVSNLQKLDKIEQLSFFNEEENNLTKSLQFLKNKYGKDAIYVASDTASFINRKNKDEEHPQ
ncbi:MAG: DNA polymerase IV [Candidatus Caccovivens sp.]